VKILIKLIGYCIIVEISEKEVKKMKKFIALALITVAGFSFADQGEKTSGQSVEIKKQDVLDRLNDDLSTIPQSIKDCVFKSATIEQLESCHKQTK
jgi:hypothetical protein